MNLDFAKMYPSAGPDVMKPGVKVITQGASGTIDLKDVVEDVVFISMTASGATGFNIINAQVGMTIIVEQNSTGVNNHAATFTGITINAAGNNVATTNADDEAIVVLMISKTRGFIVQNAGAVALS